MTITPLVAARQITMLDIFIATMVVKALLIGAVIYAFRAVRRDERARVAAESAAQLQVAEPPTTRVAVVACPFCAGECAASVRKEIVAGEPVYELICWQCHAALPETALVSLIDPAEWLRRSVTR